MIKQPTLGQELAKIRKEKGLTQEELVEKCHVSVRTIQRIESGEVTPRLSTVKILLAALDHDVEHWMAQSSDEDNHSFIKKIKVMLLVDVPSSQLKAALANSWVAGIVYFIMMLAEVVLDSILLEQSLSYEMTVGYCAVKVMAGLSFVVFIRGFLALGTLFENYLMKIAAYLYGFVVVAVATGDIILVLLFENNDLVNGVYVWTALIMFGAVEIVFGMALLRLQDGMGKLAKYAGVLEIITGISFITVILVFVGIITVVPALVIQILILFKAFDLIQQGKLT